MPQLLFVDDEPNVLKALRRVFLSDATTAWEEDLAIAFAASGPQALDYLRNHPVDLILSDYNMPGMTGVEMLKQSIALQPDAVRMLITGRGGLEIALEAVNQGHIYKYFNKPWDDEDLRISVLRALEFKAAREQMRRQEKQMARLESFQQMLVTISHYINNFNCGLSISLERLREGNRLGPEEMELATEALKASQKITEVIRILNRLQEWKTVDLDVAGTMLDIEAEVKETVKRIEEG